MNLENIVNYIYSNSINKLENEIYNTRYRPVYCNDCLCKSTVISNQNSYLNCQYKNLSVSNECDSEYRKITNNKHNRSRTSYSTKFHFTKTLKYLTRRLFSKENLTYPDRSEIYKEFSVNALKLLNEDIENSYNMTELEEKSKLAMKYIIQSGINECDLNTTDQIVKNEVKSISSPIIEEIKQILPSLDEKVTSKEIIVKHLCSLLSEKLKDEIKYKKEKRLTISSNVQNICIESANNNALTYQNVPNLDTIKSISNADIIKELSHLKNDISDLKIQNINIMTKALLLCKAKNNELKNKKEMVKKKVFDKCIQCDQTALINMKKTPIKSPISLSLYDLDTHETENQSSLSSFNNFNSEPDLDEISRCTSKIPDNPIILDPLLIQSESEKFKCSKSPEIKTSSLTIECKIYKPNEIPKRNFKREFVQSIIQNDGNPKSTDTNNFPVKQRRNITYDTLGIDKAFSLTNKSSHIPVHPSIIDIGDIVRFTRDSIRVCLGLVRFIGELPNQKEIFLGLELEKDDGLNDGIYNGKRYFQCEKNRGVFVSFQRVMMIFKSQST